MRNLNHDTLQLILGSVSTFLHETDKDKRVSNLEAFVLVRPSEKLVKQFSSPLSCSRRSTLKEVLTQMHVAKVIILVVLCLLIFDGFPENARMVRDKKKSCEGRRFFVRHSQAAVRKSIKSLLIQSCKLLGKNQILFWI
jgi:hypothetical protein